MGSCFTKPESRALYAHTWSCSNSWSSSLRRTMSSDSATGMTITASPSPAARSASLSEGVLPFFRVKDLNMVYELAEELGKGQFGIIRLCKCHATGTFYACKSIPRMREKDFRDILGEVRIMQRLSLACSIIKESENAFNVVRLHEVLEDETHVHIIMELCRGGDLFYRITKKKRFPEREAAFILKSLIQSIEFCHGMGIMHRDVKPENILFLEDSDTSRIKLGDFGLAAEFYSGKKFSAFAGTAYYVAPEVLEGEYSQEIDIWSAGVVLYIMLSGMIPFYGETEEEVFSSIKKGNLKFLGSNWKRISFPAKDLIIKMLCPTASIRLTPEQILEHPWILHHCRDVRKDAHIAQSGRIILPTPCKNDLDLEPRHQQRLSEMISRMLPTPCKNGLDLESCHQQRLSEMISRIPSNIIDKQLC